METVGRDKEYVCDATAVHTIGAANEDSPAWIWAQDLFEVQDLYIFSSPESQLFDPHFGNLPWKIWEADSNKSSLATAEEVDRFFKLTQSPSEHYFSVSLSVWALLELHSANESKCLVTNNREFWELNFSSEDRQEKTRLALMTLRGGNRLIDVFRLWELHPHSELEKENSELEEKENSS